MQEVYKLIIGIAVVMLGFPIGIILSKVTKEEIKQGSFWFKAIITLSLAGAVVFLILRNDALFFSFLFFASVTSMNLKRKPKISKKRKNRKHSK